MTTQNSFSLEGRGNKKKESKDEILKPSLCEGLRMTD
jgi:hypothetical protein